MDNPLTKITMLERPKLPVTTLQKRNPVGHISPLQQDQRLSLKEQMKSGRIALHTRQLSCYYLKLRLRP